MCILVQTFDCHYKFLFSRRPEFFEDPETFKPDRFFDLETEKTFYRFIPFLIGPRMCLGYKFALMEMKASLAVLLRGLRFDTIPGKTFKRKMRTTMKLDPVLELRVSTVEEMQNGGNEIPLPLPPLEESHDLLPKFKKCIFLTKNPHAMLKTCLMPSPGLQLKVTTSDTAQVKRSAK